MNSYAPGSSTVYYWQKPGGKLYKIKFDNDVRVVRLFISFMRF